MYFSWKVTVGAPPIAVMAASMPLHDGLSEAEYVGSLCASPVEVVKCERNDLCIPANSEFVLEGTISVQERGEQGPFGEMYGHNFLEENLMQPRDKIETITYRNDPTPPVSVPGRATRPDETHTRISTLAAAEVRQLLQSKVFL